MSILSRLMGVFGQAADQAADKPVADAAIDYDALILLDAEDLAEQGIASAYEKLVPLLREFVEQPFALAESIDPVAGSYSIRFGDAEHVVYSPELPGSEQESWGRATYFFFLLVNSQLADRDMRFHAVNSGNELAGIFLNQLDAAAACASIPNPRDWPYIPELAPPHYGQPA